MPDKAQDQVAQDGQTQGTQNSMSEEIKKAILEKEKEWQEKTADMIAKAVSTEKEKLYDTIEKVKGEKEKLEKELSKTMSEKEKERIAEEEKKKAEMDAIERVQLLETKQAEDSKRFQDVMQMKETEWQEELKKRDLAVYREKKINESNGLIIPELVQGKTTEEIDRAVELAKQRYIAIVESTKKQAMDEMLKNGKLPGPDGKDKKDESGSGATGETRPDWQRLMTMTNEDFVKEKAKFEKEFYGAS